VQAPILPQPATWHQLAFWGRSKLGGRQFDLESIEGYVVAEVREASQDEYVLVADGRHFTAVYDHPPPPVPPPPMLEVPLGSRIKVTGICVPLDVDPLNEEAPFNILLRSFSDIQVIAKPTPLNVRNLIILVTILLVAVFAVGAWNWYLERKRRHETTALAYLERRRSLVLEDLNGSRPLKEVIEQITDLVSFKLRGAASWCEIKDGPTFGQRPAIITSQRVVAREIHGRSGVFLGTLFAALPSFVKPSPDESAALALGTGLAKLAIETSNLYQAMVYRSEFDLLTDIPNRFSLEKQMETLIHEARTSGRVFGFVFIDLDRFKEINDQYGHQAGDVYLQEVAQRMKRQLRPGDMLARLGGDEFAVIVQSVHNRTEVEVIAARLEHCFDESFAVEGGQIFGSASVGIALYPEDATNRDGLLSTADAAMYVAKQARKRAAA
jgi:diguanylate cyclase (GGDEF)-like protein